MERKSLLNLLAAIIAIFAVISCSLHSANKNDSIKVGMLLPMTGNSANYGDIMKKGAELALKQAEKKYGKVPFSIVYEDSKGNAKDGVLGMRKLLAGDHTPVIVTAFTGVILAVLGQGVLVIPHMLRRPGTVEKQDVSWDAGVRREHAIGQPHDGVKVELF